MGLLDFKSKTGKINTGLRDGELIDYIITDVGIPKSHVKQVLEENKKRKEECEALKEEFVAKMPSYKEGGLELGIAILRRNIRYHEDNTVSSENIWQTAGDTLIAPDYICTTRFTQLTPHDHFNAVNKKGFKYGDLFRACGREEITGSSVYPQITGRFSTDVSYYPSVNPVRENDASIPYKDRKTADKVGKDETDKYSALLEAEKNRIKEWHELFDLWDNATEEERKVFLLSIASKRLLLCKKEDSKFEYIHPQVGMIGRAMVEIRNSTSYFNLAAIGNWDKELKKILIYSTCDIDIPDDDNKLIVKMVKSAISERNKKKDNLQMEVAQKMKEEMAAQEPVGDDDDENDAF